MTLAGNGLPMTAPNLSRGEGRRAPPERPPSPSVPVADIGRLGGVDQNGEADPFVAC